jgi:uncharacterized UBP type Zn finger protein
MICQHEIGLEPVPPRTRGCEECLKTGLRWVHLRLCLTCGHVGCCDSSPGRHATRHFHQTGHPVMASFEPGERWAWCYVDQTPYSRSPGTPSATNHVFLCPDNLGERAWFVATDLEVPEEFTPYLR